MKPILSIVIVSFNTKDYLKQCLRSLEKGYRKQISTGDYEIIVVDNNSSDGSMEMVKKEFPHVLLISQRKNTGFAFANNVGIGKSRGEYILLLNPDTVVEKDVLPSILKAFQNSEKVGIATCRVELFDESLDDACHRGFPTPWRAFCHFSGLSYLFPNSLFFNGYHLGYQNMDKAHEIDACAGAFMMICRKVGEEINWLDEDYFWYGEDLDFCYRVKESGRKILFVPEVKILHYKGVASGIKKHSQNISPADRETKNKATRARFAVMRIFYDKHYKDAYPFFIRWIVLIGIKLKYYFVRMFL